MISKPRYLISACLCGKHCRYDGGTFNFPSLQRLVENGLAIPFCPECAGGLSTPRSPCEIRPTDRRIISRDGDDRTDEYSRGAQKALELCKTHALIGAILKDGSPSCGVSRIYDGTHSGHCITGHGITAALLAQHGIALYTETDLPAELNL